MGRDIRSWRWLSAAAFLLGSFGSASAQFTPSGQFAPYQTPPYTYDEVRGEWINLETELIEPIVFLPASGGAPAVLAVANEPDDRVVFLDVNLNLVGEVVVGQGPASLARNPDAREVWVSVRNQCSVVVIDVATLAITHVLRPPILTSGTGAGHASTPGGIAFANGKAYVAATFSDELLVYDANTATKSFKYAIPLQAQHHGGPVALNDPFGVTSFGGRIFVTSHLSGNNTTSRVRDVVTHAVLDMEDPLINAGFLGPDNVAIEELVPATGFALPDFDVAIVDPSADAVTAIVKGVGSVLFTATGDPATGRVVVTNLDATNGDFVGEASFPQGKVSANRFTWIDPVAATVVGTPTVTEGLGAQSANVVMPTDVEILTNGRMYVAGYGSSNIGVFGPAGAFEGAIPTPAGPRGLAFARSLARLFCLSRAAGTVTSFNVSNPAIIPSAPLATFALPDPTFDRVKAGRIEFLKPNSGAGTASCASCHVDGRMDGAAWNLSKTLSANPTGSTPDFRDRKGVMVTQDLRGLSPSAPYHWRGEQKDIEDFNGAFQHLLKGQPLTPAPLANLKAYMLSLEFQPNPFQPMNRVFTPPALNGFNRYGAQPFLGLCRNCHALPLGTSCDITEGLLGDEAPLLAMEVTALRGMWTKSSDDCDVEADPAPDKIERVSASGFGLLHEGVIDDLQAFLVEFFNSPGELPQQTQKDEVKAFVGELDTGLGGSTMYSEILDVTTANSARADSIELFMLVQADAGNCDVAARGTLDQGAGMAPVGLVWRPAFGSTPGIFETDDLQGSTPVTITFAALEAKAALGQARLLFVGVPAGCGDRVGIDRDRDGMRDTDELQHVPALDPDDPDFDDDGLWDGYDLLPADPSGGAPSGPPQLVAGPVRIFQTTNMIKILYETDVPSPTIVRFGTSTGALVNSTGDGLQPVGPGTTNHWTRHHTAFLRPQPTQVPALTMLEPGKQYFYEIDTQGQNGATTTFGGFAAEFTLPNFPAPDTFRASAVDFVRRIKNANGTFTYATRATFSATQGVPAMDGLQVPGRFTIYDASGNYVFTNLKAAITTDALTGAKIATFVHTTLPGQQLTGDRVTFDLPMWAAVTDASGTTLVNFPFATGATGQWPDSVNFVEAIAP